MSFIALASLIGMLPALFVNEELRKVSMKNFYQYFANAQKSRAIKMHNEEEGEFEEELQLPSESRGKLSIVESS